MSQASRYAYWKLVESQERILEVAQNGLTYRCLRPPIPWTRQPWTRIRYAAAAYANCGPLFFSDPAAVLGSQHTPHRRQPPAYQHPARRLSAAFNPGFKRHTEATFWAWDETTLMTHELFDIGLHETMVEVLSRGNHEIMRYHWARRGQGGQAS